MSDIEQFIVVGLGNPGAKYAHNRHNIGFMAVDALASKLGASHWSRKFSGLLAEAPGKDKLFLLKPQTYMNLSGESVGAAARFYKILSQHVIVLYDELDLLPGKLRVKQGGGHGGHNGIKSIDAHLGGDYVRVRIGIGHPGDKHRVSDYVLSDFTKAEWEVQEKMIASIATHFALLLKPDPAGFMNKVALDLNPPIISPPPSRGRVREGGLLDHARDLRKNMTEAEKNSGITCIATTSPITVSAASNPLGPISSILSAWKKNSSSKWMAGNTARP